MANLSASIPFCCGTHASESILNVNDVLRTFDALVAKGSTPAQALALCVDYRSRLVDAIDFACSILAEEVVGDAA